MVALGGGAAAELELELPSPGGEEGPSSFSSGWAADGEPGAFACCRMPSSSASAMSEEYTVIKLRLVLRCGAYASALDDVQSCLKRLHDFVGGVVFNK